MLSDDLQDYDEKALDKLLYYGKIKIHYPKGNNYMKKIYIFSDTHKSIDGCIDVISNVGKIDAIIHAGDHADDAYDLHSIFPEIPMYSVRGNCDYFSGEPNDLTVIVEGIKIFITHGHSYNVKTTLSQLKAKGHSIEADLVVFGHTHRSMVDTDGKMTVTNPGSAKNFGTYAVVKIENGSVRADIFNM